MSSAINFDFFAPRWREGLVTFATGMMALAFAFASAGAAADALAIESVSNRADLVSGGDVLVRVTLPTPSTQAVLSLNGQPLVNALHPAPDGRGYLALVTGLNPGHNTLTLAAGSVILTGTPHGVGFARNPPVWLKAGDRIVCEIEKLGTLENPIAAA